ncbi:hypothetical protein l11_02820 [Neisseria weaveri LMG 5135]|nr:hypothetical protein l13_09140 [Neisseria weaveri ATCC 51223]EGV38835.1 hypothetical protein l11_02820 [Neisseria weaveri LMG 5135]
MSLWSWFGSENHIFHWQAVILKEVGDYRNFFIVLNNLFFSVAGWAVLIGLRWFYAGFIYLKHDVVFIFCIVFSLV